VDDAWELTVESARGMQQLWVLRRRRRGLALAPRLPPRRRPPPRLPPRRRQLTAPQVMLTDDSLATPFCVCSNFKCCHLSTFQVLNTLVNLRSPRRSWIEGDSGDRCRRLVSLRHRRSSLRTFRRRNYRVRVHGGFLSAVECAFGSSCFAWFITSDGLYICMFAFVQTVW
jgi:hypothetical protein